MTDHIVSLPPDVTTQEAASSKREALVLLAIMTVFASPPGRFALRDLEYSLSARFVGVADLSLSDALAWLGELSIATTDLAAEIAQLQQGAPDALRTLLHAQNDQGMIQLLHLADSLQLLDATGARVAMMSGPCFALRVGYNDSDPYGFYYLSLSGRDYTQQRLSWPSVVAARPDGGMAVAGPKPGPDLDAATTALHVMEQALATASNAHAAVKDALGLSSTS